MLAHVVSGSGLPLSRTALTYLSVAVVALVTLALRSTWVRPRLAEAIRPIGPHRPGRIAAVLAIVGGVLGIVIEISLIAVGLGGDPAARANLTSYAVFFVLWWLAPLGLWTLLALWLGSDGGNGPRAMGWLGVCARAGAAGWASDEVANAASSHRSGAGLELADALVPIALALTVTRFVSQFALQVQNVVFVASDPFSKGWDLFGTVNWTFHPRPFSPAGLGWTQLACVLVGFTIAMVAAHDRIVAVHGAAAARRAQPAMVLVIGGGCVASTLTLLGG